MVTLYWRGFPAIMNWLLRGETPLDGCTCEPAQDEAPAPQAGSETQREARWDEEAAAVPTAALRWGNFR